jgi:CYTH domain-containing protein
MPTLWAEVTRAWEAAHVASVLAAETFAQGVAATLDSATTRVKDVEDRAALMEREAQESVLRVEAESTATLASAREET